MTPRTVKEWKRPTVSARGRIKALSSLLRFPKPRRVLLDVNCQHNRTLELLGARLPTLAIRRGVRFSTQFPVPLFHGLAIGRIPCVRLLNHVLFRLRQYACVVADSRMFPLTLFLGFDVHRWITHGYCFRSIVLLRLECVSVHHRASQLNDWATCNSDLASLFTGALLRGNLEHPEAVFVGENGKTWKTVTLWMATWHRCSKST